MGRHRVTLLGLAMVLAILIGLTGCDINQSGSGESSSGPVFKMIAAGNEYSLAIDTKGNLYGWGRNDKGQLGDGTTTNRTTPTTYGKLKWKMISVNANSPLNKSPVTSNSSFSLGITQDGKLYVWGLNNRHGVLGIGRAPIGKGLHETYRKEPTEIGIGQKWETAFAGPNHSFAITKDGELYAWGLNWYGQLGNGRSGRGNDEKSLVPIKIGLIDGKRWKAAVASRDNSIGIDEEGQIYTWGYHKFGMLGTGGSSSVTVPTLVGGLTSKVKWKSLAVGERHAMALTEDGELYTWGEDDDGSLGRGKLKQENTLERLGELKWKSIAAKYNTSFGITEDGVLFGWGRNNDGILGDGNTNNKSTPIKPQGKQFRWKQVSVGNTHTLGLTEDNKLYGWGSNDYGQVGIGDTSEGWKTPKEIEL